MIVTDLERRAKSWSCTGCGLTFIGLAVPGELVCTDCQERERRSGEEDQARKLAPIPVLLERAGVPWRYRRGWGWSEWKKRFGDIPDLDGWRERSEEAMLLLVGAPGTGKTGLATILLADRLIEGRSGRWVRAQEVLDAHRLAWDAERAGSRRAAEHAAAALELQLAWRTADVLVLDDLGASGRWSGYAIERFHDLVAGRYDAGQLTVVTTNRTPAELTAVPQLASLVSRLTSGLVEVLGGSDRRAG